MKLSSLIEALLFSRAEPWTTLELIKALGSSNDEIISAISELESNLSGRGISLVRADDSVTLGTHPEAHAVLEKIYKEELEKPLSKASIETLSIIMYGDEITRGKIDYIRGVNSSFILRSLLVRGMIERKPYPRDRKRFMYVPTVALLAQMGVENVESLKDYERIHAEVTKSSIGAETTEEESSTQSV
ncbi:MAG: SMC-Scp complex subunit ScpB [Candidatus Pacebacteria bacterium]|nr:SMC-Scp complex subunit ScpB [Candidatus Paceibacterota bacterium]